MPLHTNKNLNDHSRLVIWEIEESPEWFLSALHLEDDELEKYNGFRTDQRRVHWLAYRYILKNIVGKGTQIRVKYDPNNKPFLDLSEEHISVSHSGKFATVIISKQYQVGIDIEQVHPRLHKVAEKFLSPEEGADGLGELSTEHLCLHWCAKEALYKLYGERKLDFRDHIHILQPPPGHEGIFKGRIRSGETDRLYHLQAEKVEDYFLVFAIDTPEF
ncbi:MAG: siderophore biosynthesis protein [Bacteroidetes bacterium]|nr:MAG: siderophore biosynthesis protein [Bacteroidota bacterium]